MEIIQRQADIFGMLSDLTRLSILRTLFEEKEYCVSEIARKVDVSLSAVSHQLARLEAQGIVHCYRRGQNRCYRLNKSPITKKIKTLLAII